MLNSYEKHMGLALKEAIKGTGKVSPNPLVGAIVVKNGKIIGKGHHKVFGQAHAEVNALDSCTESPAGSDLFVTLEPCSHFGKTPPCTDRIIKEKIARVFIGTIDPSPHSAGKGIVILKKAGIKVLTGICEEKCRLVNSAFFHYVLYRTPLIILKAAVSLDGSIATDENDSKWISNEKSRTLAHRIRNSYDAVLVGKNTVLTDDPELTVRKVKGRNPVRIVIDRDLSLPHNKKVFDGQAKTIVITSASTKKIKETFFNDRGISLVKVGEKDGLLDLEEAFKIIGKTGITSIMAEGGAAVHNYLLKNRLAGRVNIFIAPKLIGSSKRFFFDSGFRSVNDSISLDTIAVKNIDGDLFLDAFVRYHN
jgi:diaminohydroxyphosphoribosylaminopyrimidine deaminase/5-amino-6-(5-phosphoribosylamino)uracil reductase